MIFINKMLKKGL